MWSAVKSETAGEGASAKRSLARPAASAKTTRLVEGH
jgi:hypothetical protein